MAAPAIRPPRASASSSSIRSTRRRSSARCGSLSTSGRRTASSRRIRRSRNSATARWCRRCRRSAVGFPQHPRRHLHGPENHPLPVQLRTEFLSDLRSDDKPAGHHAALRGQSGQWPDLSELCAEDRQRRQRHRRHSAAGLDRAARDLHRLGAALGRLGKRWLRGFRPVHPVRAGRRPTASAAGDPRPSVEERYPSYSHISRAKVIQAVDDLVRRRFLICDDTQDIVTRLLRPDLAAGVPAAAANTTTRRRRIRCRHAVGRRHHHYHYVYDHDH